MDGGMYTRSDITAEVIRIDKEYYYKNYFMESRTKIKRQYKKIVEGYGGDSPRYINYHVKLPNTEENILHYGQK